MMSRKKPLSPAFTLSLDAYKIVQCTLTINLYREHLERVLSFLPSSPFISPRHTLLPLPLPLLLLLLFLLLPLSL
jgi:hypothetical protein